MSRFYVDFDVELFRVTNILYVLSKQLHFTCGPAKVFLLVDLKLGIIF